MKYLLVICMFLVVLSLFAGTPKDVGTVIELYPSGSATAPTSLFLNFRAYIDTRPDEIISITSLGGTYFEFSTFGLCSVDVGNFTTDWTADETLVWKYYYGSAFFGIQKQILSEGSNSQFNLIPYAIQDDLISEISGLVLFDGLGLENVEINHSEVNGIRLQDESTKPQNKNKCREITLTQSNGFYTFKEETGGEYLVEPYLSGYHFDPLFYQGIAFEDIADWDFIAEMNQTGGGSGSGPGPIDIIVTPLEHNGVLVQPEVHIPNGAGDPLFVTAVVSNSNPTVPVPAMVDLSFEIDVAGSSGPVTVILNFPIVVPHPIQNIVFFDGANWITVPADWSTPGEVTFTYDFSVLRGLETFVLFSDDPLPLMVEENTTETIETLLKGNFPNPFNPKTFIQFDVKEGETAILTIYNIKGEVVEKSNFASDTYNYEWNAEGLSSGVYFYKLSSESYTKTSKMLLLK